MKKSSWMAACLFGLLLTPSLILHAQLPQSPANRSNISGFVFDSERRPVMETQVELLNDMNSVLQRTKTDGSGKFLFLGLSHGRFAIRVLPLATNFEEQTQDVELFGLGALSVQKDFYLRVRRSGSTNTGNHPGVVFVQQVPEPAQVIYQKAVSDLEGDRVEAGVEGLQNALKLFPIYYLALEKLGLVYTRQQKYEQARDIFAKAVAVDSRSFNGWCGLSYVNYVLGQPRPAVEAGEKAVNLNSNSSDAHLFLGLGLRSAKRYEEAEKSLKQADKLAKGQSADVHWNLALLYAHNLKRYEDAASELELYLQINPTTPETEKIKKLIKQYRETTRPK